MHTSIIYGNKMSISVIIFQVWPDLVWASDHKHNQVLTNTTGETLRHLTDLCSGNDVSHTVTSTGELIYIDNSFNIIKLSNDMKTSTGLIKHTDSLWIKRSLYWSPLNGILLIGMSLRKPLFWKYMVYTNKSAGMLRLSRAMCRESIFCTSNNMTSY